MPSITTAQAGTLLNLTIAKVRRLVEDFGMPRSGEEEYDEVAVVRWYVDFVRNYATLEQISKLLGVTKRWVNRLVREQGFPRESRGYYRIDGCISWIVAHLKSQLEEAQKGGGSLAFADQRLKAIEAKRREIKLAREAGEVVRIDDAVRLFEALALNIRTGLLGLSKRAAPQLEGLARAKIESMLEQYIRELLNELTKLPDGIASLAEAKAGGDSEESGAVQAASASHSKRMGRKIPHAQPGGKL